jgi:hypothetical protein
VPDTLIITENDRQLLQHTSKVRQAALKAMLQLLLALDSLQSQLGIITLVLWCSNGK